ESVGIMARLGIGILIIPQKPWDVVASELQSYTTIYREENGEEPPAPIAAGWVFCDEDAGRAEELADRLQVPLSWVYEQSRMGNIPTHRLGRYIRFDLHEVLESQKKD
ncbi:MAG: hypothetical protein IH919_06080, partial [Deltaproteobacteria bacterium]|nr:hypothetical protein [Deltaproteobacteria bacterium]